MNEEHNPKNEGSNGPGDGGGSPGVHFSDVVAADARPPARSEAAAGLFAAEQGERYWNARGRQAWLVARLGAVLVFFCFVVGLPLGNWLAHRQIFGSSVEWELFAAYDFTSLIFAIIVPVLLLLLGYMVSNVAAMLSAAQSIVSATKQFISPDASAAYNADNVGQVVRGHMTALNESVDGALTRLASVEAMIRDHVAAIELAGEAIEHKATGAVERVADERSRLMDLTESLNAHADSFAAAIAERAKASISAIESADTVSAGLEKDFDERLGRLEAAAARAFSSFEALRGALGATQENLAASTEAIDAAAQETLKATERATAASNEAAESAAQSAAAVAAAAEDAAGRATETAKRQAEDITQSALDAAAEETGKMREATAKALDEASQASKEAIDAAREDADKAAKAAVEVSDAARQTGEAATAASKNVAAASEQARKSADEALKQSEAAANRIDDRNKALAEARAALEKENIRLENLIEEQRKRADRLAEAIATQTERLSKLAEAQLREQEAAARLAETQSERKALAAKEAEEAEKAARLEAQKKAEAEKAAQEKKAREKAAEQKPAPEKAPRETPQKAEKEPPALSFTPKGRSKPASSNGAARLDELARDIAERRSRGDGRGRKQPVVESGAEDAGVRRRAKGEVSWREILDAAEDAEPLELDAGAKKTPAEARDEAADAIRIIAKLQDFTYELETRLYGEPPPALQERFDRGDRNVFANRLLRLNEADVKRRIRSESARDRGFEQGVHHFLQGFERLLEDATTSETADEELEEYLGSPLGRVYLLIGATVGYFA